MVQIFDPLARLLLVETGAEAAAFGIPDIRDARVDLIRLQQILANDTGENASQELRFGRRQAQDNLIIFAQGFHFSFCSSVTVRPWAWSCW